MRALGCAALAAALAAPVSPGRPEWYRTVDSVHWVVKDLDAVRAAWARLGFPVVADFGEVDLTSRRRRELVPARVRVALALVGGLQVYWLQPLDDRGAYAEFLRARGDGVFSLNHAAPSRAALDEELARLRALGVGVLQTTDVDTDAGPLRLAHMDTAAEGKWTLGLVHGNVPSAGAAGPPPPFPLKLAQFAFVAKRLDAPSAYWSRLGLPAIEITRPPIRDRLYRGRPAAFDQELGWQRHGTIAYEWIRSLAGPTVYDDFLATHGEGLHHIAFEVEDLDQAMAVWQAAGFEAVQSGAWGEAGRRGSGRFVYIDTDRAGGVYVELLWNQK